MGVAPQNTMAAFRLALELGADGFELDVRASLDGELVVLHDEDLARSTDGRGRVSRTSAADLRGLRVGGEPVCLLVEALELAGEGALVHVEVKQPGIESAVVEAVRSAGRTGAVEYASFRGRSVSALRRADPGAGVALVQWHMAALAVRRAVRFGAQAVSVPAAVLLRSSVSRDAAQAGLRLYAWDVEPEQVAALRDAGVELAVADRPDLVLAALRDGRPA